MPHTTNRRGRITCSALVVVLTPGICSANGWISGVNAFRQTPEFYFIFAAIVLVESIVLWLWLQPIRGLAVLWRVLILNAVSSLAGDALFRVGWVPSSGALWKQAIPFFLLTVGLEYPLTRVLFRRALGNWKRTALISITTNLVSYALLIGIDRPVRETWLNTLRAQDRQILAQWTNTQMLAEAPGRIYATESASGGPPHRLKYFDFVDRRWHSVSNSPSIDPRYWHVEGDLLAYLTYGEQASRGLIKLTTLPDCATIRELRLPETVYRYGGASDVAISPDRTKLAALVPLHEIQGILSGSSYQFLGKTCQLVVFDIATGEMSLCPRKASQTVCWLPDSRTILFHSLRDEKLHELTTLPKGWKKKYDPRKPGNPFLEPPLFAYRPGTGVVEPFVDAPSASVAVGANRLVFHSGTNAVELLDLSDQSRSKVTLGAVGQFGGLALSPDGRFALVPLILNSPDSYWGYPTIVDLNDPSRRYYFGPTIYRVVWARIAARKD